jgi:hypothetical protein
MPQGQALVALHEAGLRPTLGVVASRFNPGPPRMRDVRTYRVEGNRISMTGTIVHADGRVENIQFDAWLDGKDYAPTGNPRVEAIAQAPDVGIAARSHRFGAIRRALIAFLKTL